MSSSKIKIVHPCSVHCGLHTSVWKSADIREAVPSLNGSQRQLMSSWGMQSLTSTLNCACKVVLPTFLGAPVRMVEDLWGQNIVPPFLVL